MHSQGDKTPSFKGLSNPERLGAGGMGTVFRAWQDDLGRAVAVKTLREDLAETSELREQFTREAHILAQLDHPGIVPVYYAGETRSRPYYVMRLVEGVAVDEHLRDSSALEVAKVFRAISESLDEAHQKGVLHRDVKPANILVEENGRAILVDFGLSTKSFMQDGHHRNEDIVGTPDYLAPELLEGGRYSPASDVYALGATLYYVLTGRVPFPAEELSLKLRAIREEDPPPLRALCPDIPKPLQAVCLKAMERSPEDRYSSAEELQKDLERFLAGHPVAALPVRERDLLRSKFERQLEEHAEWQEQGLLNERQRGVLQAAFETLDQEERGLMRGAFATVPNLLLIAGLVLTVLGPVLLLLMAWNDLDPLGRMGLPAAPMIFLLFFGLKLLDTAGHNRGVACLIAASLLSAPTAFGLADLLPVLQSVVDTEGVVHPVIPGRMWFPASSESNWVHEGARLLEWKVLATSMFSVLVAAAFYKRTRSSFFIWIIGIALAFVGAAASRIVGWGVLPVWFRWMVEILGALAVIAAGIPQDQSWRRGQALPFYGLGFFWLTTTAWTFAMEGFPVSFWVASDSKVALGGSLLLHGLGIACIGVWVHNRGSAMVQKAAGVPLMVGFVTCLVGTFDLAIQQDWLWELALVGNAVAFLLLGLALQRNSLVLPAAIMLPITIGDVSQRHMDSVWAWSITVVLTGIALVLLALRLAGRKAKEDAQLRE